MSHGACQCLKRQVKHRYEVLGLSVVRRGEAGLRSKALSLSESGRWYQGQVGGVGLSLFKEVCLGPGVKS